MNVSSSEEVLQNKLQLLSSTLPLGRNQAVTGQYQAYKSEVQQELNKTKDHVSLTPTFAGWCGKRFNVSPPLHCSSANELLLCFSCGAARR